MRQTHFRVKKWIAILTIQCQKFIRRTQHRISHRPVLQIKIGIPTISQNQICFCIEVQISLLGPTPIPLIIFIGNRQGFSLHNNSIMSRYISIPSTPQIEFNLGGSFVLQRKSRSIKIIIQPLLAHQIRTNF